MRKILLALLLGAVGACASDTDTTPVSTVCASDEDAGMDDSDAGHWHEVNGVKYGELDARPRQIAAETSMDRDSVIDVGVSSEALSACPPRPADQKLMSGTCKTCPLVWMYGEQMNDADWGSMQRAAAFWNNAMHFNVIGVRRSADGQLPTYGTVVARNDIVKFELPDNLVGRQIPKAYDCWSDRIEISPRDDMTRAFVDHVMAHEMGHELFWHFDPSNSNHSPDPASIMSSGAIHPYNYTGNNKIDNVLKADLRIFQNRAQAGYMTVPCMLRGHECN